MAGNSYAMIEMETGQTAVSSESLTDSGDNTVFTTANKMISLDANLTDPLFVIDGIVTGGAVTAAVSLANDAVDISAGTYYAGSTTLQVLAADTDVTITRPLTDVAKINIIAIDVGGAIVSVAGTDGATSAFSETIGAAGGPPALSVGQVALAQVRVSTSAAAPITAAQIKSVVGTHRDLYSYPSFRIDYGAGTLTMSTALAQSRTASATRGVWGDYYYAELTEITNSDDFKAGESSVSTSSQSVYSYDGAGSVESETTSRGQGSFTVYTDDGVTDDIVDRALNPTWFRFYPHRNKAPNITQCGIPSLSRSFGSGAVRSIAVTFSPKTQAYNNAS